MRCGDNETSCTYVNACKRDIRGVEKQMVIVRKTTNKKMYLQQCVVRTKYIAPE